MKQTSKLWQRRRLQVGTAQLELVTGAGNEFIGLGGVTIGGVALRQGARPITVRLDTPDGILYTRLVVERINRAANRVAIVLQALGLPWERGEYHDDYAQPVLWLQRPDELIADRLTLVLTPVALALGGRDWSGFAYAFEFASRSRQIHRLLTHATWEIGGRLTGNTILSQGQCNQPVYRGARGTLFTTACLRTLDQHGQPQGNSFQLGPRAGLVQGFDFQYAAAGALLQYWPEFASISSLIESPRGSDELHVIDEYRFELSHRARTTPKWVLFTAGKLAEHEARDLWWDSLQHVYGGIRKQFHVAPAVVLPEAGLSFETVLDGRRAIEVPGRGWRLDVQRRAPSTTNRLRVRFAGIEVDHSEMLTAAADHLLPRLAQQGIRRFFAGVFSESDVTVLGMKRKLDDGPHGDLHCSSVCATHRFFPSEFWGGIKAWRYLYQKAHALGMEVGHWIAPHFSPRSPIYQAHPEYQMIDALGFPASGGYSFQTIVSGDWNTGLRDRVLADLKQWQEEGGLDFVFVDSCSNLGLLQMNYAAKMRTNYAAFARFLAELQRIKIRTFWFECISPFGLGYFGLADLRGDLLEQNRAVAGQNDLGWWVGEEDMGFNCHFVTAPRRRGVAELQRMQFRLMANRGYFDFGGLADARANLPAWWGRLIRLYNQAVPHMRGRRRLLPAGAGVRWENEDGDLVWTFQDWRPGRIAGQRVCRLDGQTEHVWSVAVLPAGNVFRITSG